MTRVLKNQPGGWLGIAWEEFVGRDSSHGASFSTGWDGGSQITLQILINWQDCLQAEVELLGTTKFVLDDAATGDGHYSRTLPKQHPMKPAYYCERIVSAQPVKWDTKASNFVSGFITGTVGAPLSEYAYYLLTLGFHVPKYRVMTDAQLLDKYSAWDEWHRFTEISTRATTVMLSREGLNWKYADATYDHNGKSLTAPQGMGIYSCEWHVKQRRIPRLGLYAKSGEDDRYNKNIIAARNKVHNAVTDLWGMEGNNNNPGTGVFRLVSVDSEPIPSPFDPGAQGLTLTDYNTYNDVTYVFHEWRPPPGNANNLGHNLAPGAGSTLWWLITDTLGKTIFEMADLTTAFTPNTG